MKSLSPEIGEIEKRKALERVLSSDAFHRTGQLKSLLSYVCEREIAGHGDSLDECTVAVEALGRRPNYSPFEDGTVRNRVHNLRRRLEHYYETENPGDPIHIVIPKGSYCPVFELATEARASMVRAADTATQDRGIATDVVATAGSLPNSKPEPEPVPSPALPAFWDRPVKLRTLVVIGVAVAAATAALLVAIHAGVHPDRPSLDPAVSEAWGPLVAKNANPLLCIATSAQLTVLQRPMDRLEGPTVTSPDLLAWYRTLPALPPAKQVFLGPSLTSPFWGDVAGAFAVNQLLSGVGIASELLPESAIRMPALHRRNLVMFGRPGFSRTIGLFLADKPFRIRVPDDQYTTSIWNVEPRPGEPSDYNARTASIAAHRQTAFGLITVMPSLGDANLRTVVFSGTLSPGTQAAAEYFSSPRHLSALLALFQKEGYAGFPASYQVLVRSTVFDTSALDVRYVTHRVIAGRSSASGDRAR